MAFVKEENRMPVYLQKPHRYSSVILQTIRHSQVTNVITKEKDIGSHLHGGSLINGPITITQFVVKRSSHIKSMLVFV